MANLSKTTRDHDVIRAWAEERGGRPAHVRSTGSGQDIGLLRLDFSGHGGLHDENLEEIEWEEFFEKFDDNNLALVYQETTAEGQKSNFNKLVSADSVDLDEEEQKDSGGRSSDGGSSSSSGSSSGGNASTGKTS